MYDFVYISKLWLSILYSLQLVEPIENKMTVVQGKLKSMPIICIYVTYVTISIMYDCFFFVCFFFNIFKTLSNVCSLVLSSKEISSSLSYHYCIDEWSIYVAYEYLVYEDFCGGVGQFNCIKETDFNRYIRYRGKLSLNSLIGYFCHTLTLQNHVYKLSAQVARLTTLCIEFSIKLTTR